MILGAGSGSGSGSGVGSGSGSGVGSGVDSVVLDMISVGFSVISCSSTCVISVEIDGSSTFGELGTLIISKIIKIIKVTAPAAI